MSLEIPNLLHALAFLKTTSGGVPTLSDDSVGFTGVANVGTGVYELTLREPLKPYTLGTTFSNGLAMASKSLLASLVSVQVKADGTKIVVTTTGVNGAAANQDNTIGLTVYRAPTVD